MPFNATVNLGTVGSDITGQTVSISGCTGTSCGDVCTSLATLQAVSSFPKVITGIPDNVVSLFVSVDGGPCVGTTQCISVTQVETTPTPTPTINASPTPTPTPTINASPTPTPTPIQGASSGCVTMTQSESYTQINCLGQGPYNVTTTRVTATLAEISSVNVTVRVNGTINYCYGTSGIQTYDITITAGSLSNYVDITTSSYVDCGQGSCIIETITIDGYESLTSNYTICNEVIPTPTPTPTPFIAYCYEIIIPTDMFTDINNNKLRVAYQKYGGTPAEFNYDEYFDSGENSPSYTIKVCSISEPVFTYGSSGGYFNADGLITVNGGTVTCSTSIDCGGNDPSPIIPTPTASVGGSYCYDYQSVVYGPFETLQDCTNAINNSGHIGSCYECIAGPNTE